MEYRGIDVSKYQNDINFNKIKDVDFVIIRIGYGMYESQKDSKFERNYEGFKNINVPIGVYLYSYAKSEEEAKKEALVVLKWLNGRSLDLPVYFDIEDKSQVNLGKKTLTNMCDTFCGIIEKAGYKAGIYANKYFFTTYLDYEKLQGKYAIWVAQYNDRNTYGGRYDMWQYTSNGKVDGIKGYVDMNILYNELLENSLPDLSNYNGTSIVDGLKSVNYDSSFLTRKKLYSLLGYKDLYKGSALQNNNLLNSLKKNEYYECDYMGLSFVDALKSMGVDSSMTNRMNIALNNGITNYRGTYMQNIKLLNMLKKGVLKK